jgi:transposase
VSFLHYKAESAGCEVIDVNPRNTTQECSRCGYIKQGDEVIDISVRIYNCNNCGLTMDRDENSGRVIKKRGLEKFNQLPKDIREAASGDIARPQLQEADVYESGTIFGVSR